MRPTLRLASAALLLLPLAGCSTTVALRTAAAPADACDDGAYGGVLELSAQSGLAVRGVASGEVVEVVWPIGYAATRDLGGVVTLRDPSGNAIANEGETITMGGGRDDEGVWTACAGTVLNAPGI